MTKIRSVHSVTPSRPTVEGAGVHLRRAFGRVDERLDPFLLLDDFGSDDPKDFRAGFPWHPHRGIETITSMVLGEVAHGDSLGNKGVIQPGDVQWMTAGSGIIHEEMPRSDQALRGFQLWANLPADQKMRSPRYQEVAAGDVPVTTVADGVEVRVICGEVGGVRGPVRDIVIQPQYFELRLEAEASCRLPVTDGHNALAYVIDGRGAFGAGRAGAGARHLVVFDDGDEVSLEAGPEGLRCLLISGRPLREPVAWGGPIVMNTEAELRQAFEEYEAGTFIKD